MVVLKIAKTLFMLVNRKTLVVFNAGGILVLRKCNGEREWGENAKSMRSKKLSEAA